MAASPPPEGRPTRAQMERQLKKLQDNGVVDLDAPLRDVIPVLAKSMVRYRATERWWIIASGGDPHAVCECSF